MTKKKSCYLFKLARLIKFVLQTEKTLLLLKNNVYTFIVNKKLKKVEIKEILEKFYLIQIDKIRSLNIRKNGYKKVYITLNKTSNSFNFDKLHKSL